MGPLDVSLTSIANTTITGLTNSSASEAMTMFIARSMPLDRDRGSTSFDVESSGQAPSRVSGMARSLSIEWPIPSNDTLAVVHSEEDCSKAGDHPNHGR